MATPAPPNVDSNRYAYLVERLRTKRITMEEATELFSLQQAIIRAAYQPRSAAPPPALPVSGEKPPPKVSVSSPTSLFGTDDALLLGILALGAGTGLMAALAKHTRGDPAHPSLEKHDSE